jgi:hypothetical protein
LNIYIIIIVVVTFVERSVALTYVASLDGTWIEGMDGRIERVEGRGENGLGKREERG